ncbi:MAG TPA: PQQ-binding-like beta-propeller repeat protein, partial [Gammaproteobacteria bacterium]|nr:PQQ-binding-like beta-propeller repeat protein [Gammaproteobacteria bacterium]
MPTSPRIVLPFIVTALMSACSPPSGGGSETEAAPTASTASGAPAEAASADGAGQNVEWRFYGGNLASQRYSPLDQIDASNAGQLKVAWRFNTGNYGPRPEARNETTPLMIDGVLYTQVGITRNVVAINPKSGELLWVWRPDDGEQRFARAPRKTSGRGPAYWSDDAGNERLFTVTPGFHLAALDPDTGRPVPGFGENGIVDLMVGVRGEVNDKSSIGNSSPPTIVGDVVIVGPAHEVGMRPPSKANLKGDVRGYDARTGKLLWTFHTIPTRDEPGYETWLNGSAEIVGNAGVWAPMTADAELGYVYLPTEAPLADTWGGERHGNNLYSSSLVCLDAKTGERVWHYQLIHHDIWDWDNPTAPILMDLVVDGRPIKAVAQLTKQAFVYTFDRVTGEPVWPIEERPVPQTDVPGEWTSPTQPFPTKPPPYDRQGVSIDDLIDFTPELRAEAVEGVKAFRLGPIFTPPSLANASDGTSGTLMLPHATGGANWEGGAFDPETNVLYVGSFTNPFVLALEPPPYDRQGVTIDDLIDFTPELRAEAVEGVKKFRLGPIFTPPSLAKASDGTSGTLMLPHATGGANWEGGAFDPETNVLYVGSFTNPFVLALEPPPQPTDITYISGGGAQLPWLQGLPLIKPPWGRITAI